MMYTILGVQEYAVMTRPISNLLRVLSELDEARVQNANASKGIAEATETAETDDSNKKKEHAAPFRVVIVGGGVSLVQVEREREGDVCTGHVVKL